MLEERGRKPEEIDLIVSPGEHACDADIPARYAELGVSEVVVICLGNSLDEFERNADAIEKSLIRAAKSL